ncbi:MAG TPA: hypothetical protein VNQ79_10480 [Blastocatellia bacterium]|nr:hypothetical protein [Blastocatellia bacterium]
MISQRTSVKAIALALVLTACGSVVPAGRSASAFAATRATGKLLVRGQVSVNGIAAVPGVSVLNRSRIRTGSDGMAVVSLGKQGRIEIASDSEMVLQLSDGAIGGTLINGQALVSAPQGTAISLAMADATATTDGLKSSILIASLEGGSPRVATVGGSARVALGNRTEMLASGQQALLAGVAGRSEREIRIGDAGNVLAGRSSSSRAASDGRLVSLLNRSVGQTGDTVSGGTPRPQTGGGLPTRSRQPDNRRTPPQGFDSRRTRDVSRIIP